ncbi:coiled-coil domain-containing protein 15 [Nelusetta ayraudi]|uniref:coiled-coil domain-containing protein 15 n=1 Tax=Nelusetta ayraudi TaxID=303726 RepID=UPI003F70F2CF
MSASRPLATHRRCRAMGRSTGVGRASRVLAQRNQAVATVGAWVEEGPERLQEHPFTLALQTDEIQAERRRRKEESLQRFQGTVRHRLAVQAQANKRKPQHTVNPIQPHRVLDHSVSTDRKPKPAGGAAQHREEERGRPKSSASARQVRLRLAACRRSLCGEVFSELPGEEWNMSPNRHTTGCLVDEEEEEDDQIHTWHNCPLVQKQSESELWKSEGRDPNPDLHVDPGIQRVLWPLPNSDEVNKQRRSRVLIQRRHYMNVERQLVKESERHRKHLRRATGIKAEKERLRRQEEANLEREQRLAETRQRLEERELLILERLKLEEEEEEERAAELQRRKREENKREAARFMEALRAQLKERLSKVKHEPPPLCFCASTFWDSHPDTCANNCIFHNNHKAYVKALQSTLVGLDL